LKLNVFKSLKALAGDDDSLFVIIDDRDDPWFIEEINEETGIRMIVTPKNLLKIPAYFYYDDKNS